VSRLILVLGSPIRNYIGFGAKLKFVNTIARQRAFIKEFHGGCFEYGNQIFAHPGQVLVVVAPLEGWGWGTFVFGGGFVQKIFGVKREGAEQLATLNGKDFNGIRITRVVIVGNDVVLLGGEHDKIHTGRGQSG
jgi:hypothetical protein